MAQVQGMLSNPDPAVKGRVFNALSTLPEEERNATLAKIGKDRPDLMVSVAAGSMMKAAPEGEKAPGLKDEVCGDSEARNCGSK